MNKSPIGATILMSACFILILTGMSTDASMQVFGQDLTIHSNATSSGMMGRGGGTTTETTYISKNFMKVVSSDGNDSIIRLDEGKIISINNKKKTYSEMSLNQVQESLDKIGSKTSKEDTEMLKKALGSIATSFTVTKQGAGEEIAGYTTEKYIINGPISMEIWAAPSLKMPASYYDVMKLKTPSTPLFDFGKLYEEMKKINGCTLKTVMNMKIMNMETKNTSIATSIEKEAIPPSVFETPAGYKLIPFNLK